jgi:hypothetical protein
MDTLLDTLFDAATKDGDVKLLALLIDRLFPPAEGHRSIFRCDR